MALRRDCARHTMAVCAGALMMLAGSARLAYGQVGSLTAGPHAAGTVDETNLVTLTGNTLPPVLLNKDLGPVADDFPLQHMYLVLRRSPEQQHAMDDQLADLQNPKSANYHHWLTADDVGKRYSPAQGDIETVTNWLSSHGFTVHGVAKSGMTIDVSGTAGQIREAFHTEIHQYQVNGQTHIANASDPKIPAALASVVAGFSSLNDFRPQPQVRKASPNFTFKCAGCPDGFNNQDLYFEAPADFATIYNVAPLYAGKVTGKGQTIAVVETTDILANDVATFRKAFGLSSYSGTFSQIHPGPGCADPGTNGAEIEGALDAEWAGAVAPDAAVQLAACANTQTNYGFLIAVNNLINSNSPPAVISVSYGICEPLLGPGFNLLAGVLWEQAALEGISVIVASGDGGAAFCDFNLGESWATEGIAVNGIASTPFNFAAGGTDFLDTFEGTNGTYWSATNTATGKSAKSYVPEMTWNDSCASSVLFESFGFTDGFDFCNTAGAGFIDIVGGSGGPSTLWAKPSWQENVVGMSNDGHRDLPDASLFSSNGFWFHAILFCMSDATEGGSPCNYSNPLDAFANSAGGTSFAAPQFAGIQALINQKAGAPQGNPAPIYYDLYRSEFGTPASPLPVALADCNASLGSGVSPACLFHDVTVGNNDVPCYGLNFCWGGTGLTYGVLSLSDTVLEPAYPAHTGWDFATGLGSINVAKIVNAWP